jgi:hypothetical protein
LLLNKKPFSIIDNEDRLKETKNAAMEGYTWQPLQNGGVIRLNHLNGSDVKIFF